MARVQSNSGRLWTPVSALTPDLQGRQVLLRARIHAVRGKGKSAFLVLRQSTATVQARTPLRQSHGHGVVITFSFAFCFVGCAVCE